LHFVSNVDEAVRVLHEQWPAPHATTRKHKLAQRACLAAMEGKMPSDKVAVALTAAARQAGLLEE
jgi:hypothetical protein